MGYGEEETASDRELEMLMFGSRSGKNCTLLPRGILWKWSTSRRTAQRKDTSQFEMFVTEGNDKADELANAGAMLDEGKIAEVRAKTMQQEREEVCAALQYAASFHC